MNDPYISCPYNMSHQVPRSRIQAHIIKCQKNYPELVICPYNATHRVTKEEMKNHVEICPTRVHNFMSIEKEGLSGTCSKPKILDETDPNHEIWDD